MTLIAAWKLPVNEDDADPIGIRLVSDSLLSQPQGGPITPIWKKVYDLKPILRVPRSACDEDWWEFFSHFDHLPLKPIGVFFAGSALAFNFAQVAIREILEELGLKAIYKEDGVDEHGEPRWRHFETRIVRNSEADSYRWSGQDDLNEELYFPPPKLNLSLVASLLCGEMNRFYASIDSGPIDLTNRKIRYDVSIGIAGYCEATSQFRIFELHPEPEPGPDPAYQIVRMVSQELPDNEMLLMGRTDLRAMIEQRVADEASKSNSPGNSEAEHQAVARQSVLEDIIQNNPPQGVGGGLIRADVTRQQGFRFVETPWNPAKARVWRTLA